VDEGAKLPGLPDHNLAVGFRFSITEKMSVGIQADFVAGQYLRGDEANLLEKLDSYSVVDLGFNYQFTDALNLSLEVENLFDSQYHSFGLFGEPDEIIEEFTNPIFLSSSQPRGAWFKAAYNW